MGRFADAVHSHSKNLFYSKEGGDILIRNKAKKALAKDLHDMIESIEDDFDEADEQAYQWVREQE
jgi:hypothetical protein